MIIKVINSEAQADRRHVRMPEEESISCLKSLKKKNQRINLMHIVGTSMSCSTNDKGNIIYSEDLHKLKSLNMALKIKTTTTTKCNHSLH